MRYIEQNSGHGHLSKPSGRCHRSQTRFFPVTVFSRLAIPRLVPHSSSAFLSGLTPHSVPFPFFLLSSSSFFFLSSSPIPSSSPFFLLTLRVAQLLAMAPCPAHTYLSSCEFPDYSPCADRPERDRHFRTSLTGTVQEHAATANQTGVHVPDLPACRQYHVTPEVECFY